MRRIAHVISTPEGIGGAERVMLALLREGVRRGYQQIVFDPFDLEPRKSALSMQISVIEDVAYAGKPTKRLWEVPTAARWLRRGFDLFHPDLIHVHLFHAMALSAFARRRSGTMIATHHHGDHLGIAGRRWQARIDRWAVGRMDHVVACSDWVRRFLMNEYACSSSKITTIPNGWEGNLSASEHRDPNQVLCVANFRREKDHGTLIEAFEILASKLQDARLLLVGDGPLRKAIEDRVTSSRLAGRVTFAGAVENVWPYYAAAGILVLPSIAETLGMAALEAMAASLPVVATSVGGIPEIVTDDETGILIPPKDPRSMAQAIEHLLSDREKACRLGAAGRAVAETRRMDLTVARYFDLYETFQDPDADISS